MYGTTTIRTSNGLLVPEYLADEGVTSPPPGIPDKDWRTLRVRSDGVAQRTPDGTDLADLGLLTDKEAVALRRGVSGGGGERLYQAYCGVAPTTVALVPVTTSTAIKTLLQIATATTRGITIVEWGISFDGFAAALPGRCEFFGCTGAASTLTTLNAADIVKYNNPNDESSTIQLGTALSGFNTSGGTEGTVAAWRGMDTQFVAPTNQYIKQFPLGREPCAALSTFLRVRVTFGTAVNAYCYILWSE